MESSEQVSRAYQSFAPWYDAFYGAILSPGRRAAVHGMGLRPGDRVLEVGVGTGLSLSAYPDDVRVSGIDIAPEMLERAQRRVTQQGLTQIDELKVMDARDLHYPDGYFDVVVAMYLISVSPNPQQVVAEMRRVCRPGGLIVIVNHFRTESRLIRGLEAVLRPLHRKVNYSAELEQTAFIQQSGLQVEQMAKANILGYSTILYCRIVC